MTDMAFGQLLADPAKGIAAASQQVVSLWRRGLRSPRPPYDARIVEVTNGEVTLHDLRKTNQPIAAPDWNTDEY